jgi:hypothetical protein
VHLINTRCQKQCDERKQKDKDHPNYSKKGGHVLVIGKTKGKFRLQFFGRFYSGLDIYLIVQLPYHLPRNPTTGLLVSETSPALL